MAPKIEGIENEMAAVDASDIDASDICVPNGVTMLLSDRPANVVMVNDQGALLVDGIENWIAMLAPVQDLPSIDGALYMQDTATGAVFLIKRVR